MRSNDPRVLLAHLPYGLRFALMHAGETDLDVYVDLRRFLADCGKPGVMVRIAQYLVHYTFTLEQKRYICDTIGFVLPTWLLRMFMYRAYTDAKAALPGKKVCVHEPFAGAGALAFGMSSLCTWICSDIVVGGGYLGTDLSLAGPFAKPCFKGAVDAVRLHDYARILVVAFAPPEGATTPAADAVKEFLAYPGYRAVVVVDGMVVEDLPEGMPAAEMPLCFESRVTAGPTLEAALEPAVLVEAVLTEGVSCTLVVRRFVKAG